MVLTVFYQRSTLPKNFCSSTYKGVFSQLQRGKALEEMVFMGRYYLLSLDGTGYFSSQTVHCDACLERKHKDGKTITYSHHMLGAAIVHPEHKAVIPLAPEPIIKQDGSEKNDCERNAAKRFFEHLRQDHPRPPLIVCDCLWLSYRRAGGDP